MYCKILFLLLFAAGLVYPNQVVGNTTPSNAISVSQNVCQASVTGVPSSSLTCTWYPSAPSVNDTGICIVFTHANHAPYTISDSANTWIPAGPLSDLGGGISAQIFSSFISTPAKSVAWSITNGTDTSLTLSCIDSSNVAATNMVDGYSASSTSIPANAIPGGGLAPTANGDLVFCLAVSQGSSISSQSGFTPQPTSMSSVMGQYQIQATATPVIVSMPLSSPSTGGGICGSFRPASTLISINNKSCFGSSSGTPSSSIPCNWDPKNLPVSGDTISCIVLAYSTGHGYSLTDDAGTKYNAISGINDIQRYAQAQSYVSAPLTNQVTITKFGLVTGTDAGMAIGCVAAGNVATTNPVDAVGIGINPNGANPISAGNIATSVNGDLVFCLAQDNQTFPMSVPTNFTGATLPTLPQGGIAYGWTIQTSAGAVAYGFPATGPTTGGGMCIAVRPAGTVNTTGSGSNGGFGGTLQVGGCDSVPQNKTCTLRFNVPVQVSLDGYGTVACNVASNCTTAVFQAPPNITQYNKSNYFGCPANPIDTWYNTPINNLPLNANSAQWTANLQKMYTGGNYGLGLTSVEQGTNLVDNNTPTTLYSFNYNKQTNGIVFPNPIRSTWVGEGGTFNFNFNMDQRFTFLNINTCNIYETYNVQSNNTDDPSDPKGFNAVSAGFLPFGYNNISGGTGAANQPYANLVLTANDVINGLFHPLTFVIGEYVCRTNAANPNAPLGDYCNIPSIQATTGGPAGQVSAFGWAWPATWSQLNNTAYTPFPSGPPTNTLPGLGSWGRLKQSWCQANLPTFTGYQYNIYAGLCNYGFILTDWGICCVSKMDSSVYSDPAVMAAINKVTTSPNVLLQNWEWIDQSPLSPCIPWWDCSATPAVYGGINPHNQYQPPPTYSIVTAVDPVSNQIVSKRIGVQPVTIGFREPWLIFPAGSQPYQLTAFVNGTDNQTVTWSAPTGITVTPYGLLTIPTNVSNVTRYNITATSVADSAASATISVTVFPTFNQSGWYFDSGYSGVPFQDGAGTTWVAADLLPQLAGAEQVYIDTGWPVTNLQKKMWSTSISTTYGGDIFYKTFVLPPGQYKATIYSSPSNGTWGHCQVTPDFLNTLYIQNGTSSGWDVGENVISVNNSIAGHIDFGLLNQTGPYLCHQPQSYTFPALVGNDGLLRIGLLAQTQVTSAGTVIGATHTAWINGFSIVPDPTTAPHWTIDTQGYNHVLLGKSLQLYLIDWYTGSGANNSIGAGGIPIKANTLAGDGKWSAQCPTGAVIDPINGLLQTTATATTGVCIVTFSNGVYSASTSLYIGNAK